MLETVDFTQEAPEKEEYKAKRDELMQRLTALQQRARAEHVGLVVLFEGWNGAGKGSRISDLMYRLDARATTVHVTSDLDMAAVRGFAGAPWGVQDFYPPMQQFWKALGERGTITFYDRGWYSSSVERMLLTEAGDDPLLEDDDCDDKKRKHGDEHCGKGRKSRAAEAAAFARDERRARSIDRAVESAAEFERQLVNDGAQKLGAKVYLPELKFCGDNGAMIAAQGYYQYIAGHTAGLELNGLPTLPIDYE